MNETKLKKLNITYLVDFYGALLTQNQQKMISMFYEGDFSLGEIAEQFNITRQGVRDCILKAEKALVEAETKLGFVSKIREINSAATQLHEIVKQDDDVLAIVNKIISLTEV